MLKRIAVEEFDRIYEELKSTFPPYRVKTLDEYKTLLSNEKYQCFAFLCEGKEVGFVIGYVFQNDESKSYTDRYGFFHMDYLAIYEDYRNQGYGRKLMKELLDEPFTKKAVFFALPLEGRLKDDESDPYFERRGLDSSVKAKRFFDRFSQVEISHYQNDEQFVYAYPSCDGQLRPMSLHLIKGFHKDLKNSVAIFYDEFASLLKESEDYIHQNNPLKEKAYETYKDTIVKTTAPYAIPATHYELVEVDLDSDKMIQDVKDFVINGDKILRDDLFDGYVSFDAFKALLLKDTVFNAKNILALYSGDNGELIKISQLILFLDKFPENNREEILSAFSETGAKTPEGFGKAMAYLEGFKSKMQDGERRILFISKGTSYYSQTISESALLTKLPYGKTYVIEVEKDDLFKIMDYTKLGFKVRKEYKDAVELCKTM
ncbi:MAG: GNAT family N-acetyltransferase [Clostridia bacterium]|nr:GNAT family N-acetyltransferase [Clostridia bacterium]